MFVYAHYTHTHNFRKQQYNPKLGLIIIIVDQTPITPKVKEFGDKTKYSCSGVEIHLISI